MFMTLSKLMLAIGLIAPPVLPETEPLTNTEIAAIVTEQFDYLDKVERSSGVKQPKNFFITYVGDLDIEGISKELKPKFKGGIDIKDGDYGYKQHMQAKHMPLHKYLFAGIPNWFVYSLNWVLRKQSLLISVDPDDIESAIFSAHLQGEKHYDKTLTFLKPELLLELKSENDLKKWDFTTKGLAGVIFLRKGKLIKTFKSMRNQKGYIDPGCGIAGWGVNNTDSLRHHSHEFLHILNFRISNAFYQMGVDPVSWKLNKRQYLKP